MNTSKAIDISPVTAFQSFSMLPDEMCIEIMARLPAKDIGRLVCTSHKLTQLSKFGWRTACIKRWPRWSTMIGTEGDAAQWRRKYEYLELRESEVGMQADIAAIRRLQQLVPVHYRETLVEWLCEVSNHWHLDSTVVFKAVAYMDHYMAQHVVEHMSRFQLLGLACLRMAMGDARFLCTQEDNSMDAQRFVTISDDAYTTEEVEEYSLVIANAIPAAVRVFPNAKMIMRKFWHQATLKKVVLKDEIHIYATASFILQLSLLVQDCSSFSSSMLAASALSVAFTVFGQHAWPVELQIFASYEAEELACCKAALVQAQATQSAYMIRQSWWVRCRHDSHIYDDHKDQWARLLKLLYCKSDLDEPGGDGRQL